MAGPAAERFIALYRGINVVGKNVVRMEALRALHEGLGHREVATYIQSGNVVFSVRGTAERIAAKIAKGFTEEFGFAARVMVVPRERWAEIVQANPYGEFSAARANTVHAGICSGEPSAAGLKALHQRVGTSEKFIVREGVLYLHAPDGFGTSKFASGMEKAGGVPMTVRNWRTVEALWNMLEA